MGQIPPRDMNARKTLFESTNFTEVKNLPQVGFERTQGKKVYWLKGQSETETKVGTSKGLETKIKNYLSKESEKLYSWQVASLKSGVDEVLQSAKEGNLVKRLIKRLIQFAKIRRFKKLSSRLEQMQKVAIAKEDLKWGEYNLVNRKKEEAELKKTCKNLKNQLNQNSDEKKRAGIEKRINELTKKLESLKSASMSIRAWRTARIAILTRLISSRL